MSYIRLQTSISELKAVIRGISSSLVRKNGMKEVRVFSSGFPFIHLMINPFPQEKTRLGVDLTWHNVSKVIVSNSFIYTV